MMIETINANRNVYRREDDYEANNQPFFQVHIHRHTGGTIRHPAVQVMKISVFWLISCARS